MNRYLSFALAVFALGTLPNHLVGDEQQSDWRDNDKWSVDIRLQQDGIEVMCLHGCNFKTASVKCVDGDDGCILGLGESGVGGGSGTPFQASNSVFD